MFWETVRDVKSVFQSGEITLKENKTIFLLHSYSINPRNLLFDHMTIISAVIKTDYSPAT